ncbi:hypothetical protein C0081_05630 [Cohaesibacter celericrescens]|uniref:DUF2946 domain-containing protein n=2 Tax=Cohaesibacter celericrescens TaxID=2067669 RepID=A0A2N5XUG1_9HYPH|nr:hypothetical protein C0081_05630 [Cohaesibacter celericrescens]
MKHSHGSSSCAHKRSEMKQILVGELKRFLTELCVVLSLLMMLVQTYPAASSAMNEWTPICSSAGLSLVQIPSDENVPNDDCTRCVLCFTHHNSFVGVPVKTTDMPSPHAGKGFSQPELVANSIPLPDHLLPFSGAPPPFKQVEPMLHTYSVSVSPTPNTVPVMPEIISWH